jgi:hypothetical protein
MLWINLGIIFLMLILWFIFQSRIPSQNRLQKILSNIVFIIILTDCCFTLLGQPVKYWLDYSKCWEGSFLGEKLLLWHPLIFTLVLVSWATFTAFLIRKLTLSFASIVFFALFLGHSLGAFSWFQLWLKKWIEILIRHKIKGIAFSIYWEFSKYLLYILLGFIFSVILKKIFRNRSS